MKIFLISLVLVIFAISIYLYFYVRNIETINDVNTDNIIVKGNEIKINSLTLKQKISQMIIIRGDNSQNLVITNFNVGGIFLDRQKSEEDYKQLIQLFQNNSKIKLFVSTDLEGAWNPFSNFKDFKEFSLINSKSEAYDIGQKQGEYMKKIGFNLNFAPVAEYYDKSYGGGRVFNGSKKEIRDKLKNYINGLQKNVIGTCKHYPGKGMIGNLHIITDQQNITKDDLELFTACLNENISAIMIGHQIVSGEINSFGKPSSITNEVIDSLGNFSGLIISDEVNMQGLKLFYNSKTEMYRDLINSGENLILDFELNPKEFNNLINKIEEMVNDGEIDEGKIDESVGKILKAKGYKVK